jgi:hypothetical protein
MEVNEDKEANISHFRLLQLDDEGSLAQNGCSMNEVMRYVAIRVFIVSICFCSVNT